MSQLQVLAEDAYNVLQDAIDELEELKDAAGDDEESDEDDDEEEEEEEEEEDKDEAEDAKGIIIGGQENGADNRAAAEAAEFEKRSAVSQVQPSCEADLLQTQKQSCGFNNHDSQPDQIQCTQPIYSEDSPASAITQATGSKLPADEPPGRCYFGLLKEPEWGLMWVMGMLGAVSLGLMTAMAQSEDCGCGNMTFAE